MNIGERATVLAASGSREKVLADAAETLEAIAQVSASELVSGEQVARIIAGAMVKTTINGGEPRVIRRIMTDTVSVTDRRG